MLSCCSSWTIFCGLGLASGKWKWRVLLPGGAQRSGGESSIRSLPVMATWEPCVELAVSPPRGWIAASHGKRQPWNRPTHRGICVRKTNLYLTTDVLRFICYWSIVQPILIHQVPEKISYLVMISWVLIKTSHSDRWLQSPVSLSNIISLIRAGRGAEVQNVMF